MDPDKQLRELDILVNRAKRAGITVYHYPASGVAVLRLPPAKPVAATDTPPPPVPPAPAPAAL